MRLTKLNKKCKNELKTNINKLALMLSSKDQTKEIQKGERQCTKQKNLIGQ